MKILNFGSCNIDYVYKLDHIVTVGETETSNQLEIFPGGKGLNQSIAIAKSWSEVFHAGYIGFDGTMLLDTLKENKVNISLLKKVEQKNGHAIIQVNKNAENSIFLYPGSNNIISKEYIDGVFNHFGNDDVLLLQNEINNIDYIINIGHEKNMCIILNPSPITESIFNIDFNKLSYLILNEIEAEKISKKSTVEDCLSFFKDTYPNLKVVLTLGKNGSVYQDQNQRIYHPIFEVKAVDTTAAGDTFTGFFINGITRGDDYSTILKRASCASALAVSKNGAAPSIPDYSEVNKALELLSTK